MVEHALKGENKISVENKVKEVKIVPMSMLQPNAYNPNRFSGGKSGQMMALLKQSLRTYGLLFPLITSWDEDKQKYRIIDGYHRYEALKQLEVEEVAILDMRLAYHDAVQLTVLMNRIKGFHQVELMSDLVMKLEDLGLEDSEICKNLGMEDEEYYRLKQQLGIAHAFRSHEYTKSWEEE